MLLPLRHALSALVVARISTIQPVQPVVLPFEDGVAAGADLLHLRHILHALQGLRSPLQSAQGLPRSIIEVEGGADVRWLAVMFDGGHVEDGYNIGTPQCHGNGYQENGHKVHRGSKC